MVSTPAEKNPESDEKVTIMESAMEKPDLDTRSYRVVRLPNQLEALLISDPQTDKSSAALDVNVGYFNDPEEIPGLAHSLEHLLFMGTEKYPNEADYLDYLSSHSATRNGSTTGTSTVYFFEIPTSANRSNEDGVSTDAASLSVPDVTAGDTSRGDERNVDNPHPLSPFYGALDRFAQFFISPLFLKGSLDREINAVDSEFKRNYQNDDRRLWHLNKSLFNPQHPMRQFSTGNRRSLIDELPEGLDLHTRIKEFYKEQYSANRMKLVVLAQDSLDELEERVVDLFSAVKNRSLPRNIWDVPVYSEAEYVTQLFIKSITDRRTLEIQFPYPEDETLLLAKPWEHLSYVLNQQGPGSLFSYLKNDKGWINTLTADVEFPSAPLLDITLSLTKEGLENYEQVCIDVFHYISLMQEQLPDERIFLESQSLAELSFRYREKWSAGLTAKTLARTMQKPYPRNLLLGSTTLIRGYEPDAIRAGLANLSADKCRIIVISRDFPGDWDKTEKWYGTEYKYRKIPDDLLHRLCNLDTESRPPTFRLPAPNEFIPSDLSVNRPTELLPPLKQPELIRDDDTIRLWYKKDDQFWVPKANLFILLRFPCVNLTPRVVALSELYCGLVRDSLTDYARDAADAGLRYSLSAHEKGLLVEVYGYNDKLHVLLDKVLHALFHVEVREDRFTVTKDRQRINREKRGLEAPARQMDAYISWLLKGKAWINDQILKDLIDVEVSEVIAFKPMFLQNLHAEVIAHGNLSKDQTLSLAESVRTHFANAPSKPFPPSLWPIHRTLIPPSGSSFLYTASVQNPKEPNNCANLIFSINNNSSRRLRATASLFAQLIYEPAFTRLRTQLQLGYIVQRGLKMTSTWLGFHILVQSEKAPEYLETCIEEFLVDFGEDLKKLEQRKLETQKAGVVAKLVQKPNNLIEETNRFWGQVVGEMYDFERAENDAEEIEKLTQQDILDFFNRYISPSSTERAKLAIHLVSQVARPSVETDIGSDQTTLVVGSSKNKTQDGFEQDSAPETNGHAGGATATAKTAASTPTTKVEVIRDVRAFKSGLPASDGPRPVQPLLGFAGLS